MPLPLIIIGAAAVCGLTGIGAGVQGGIKMAEANSTMDKAKAKQNAAVDRFKKRNTEITNLMDGIGKHELEILSTFKDFSDTIEKIQGRPDFQDYKMEGLVLPKFTPEDLKNVSMGAGILIGGIGGAAVGTAGGFAAAGATTAAVMALGTASTGTAIASLSGVAATNATLAALGGGAIAAGGGGMAAGAAVLGVGAAGVGLLIGGIIFGFVGRGLSDKADEALKQAEKTEKAVDEIISYYEELDKHATVFGDELDKVDKVYRDHLGALRYVVEFDGKTHWKDFSEKEKKMTQNSVLLVGLLYKMCQVKLVIQAEKEGEINKVNKEEIAEVTKNADSLLAAVID